jgi:hypothetical protein
MRLQQGHGVRIFFTLLLFYQEITHKFLQGWNPRMAEFLSKIGTVHRITGKGCNV